MNTYLYIQYIYKDKKKQTHRKDHQTLLHHKNTHVLKYKKSITSLDQHYVQPIIIRNHTTILLSQYQRQKKTKQTNSIQCIGSPE